MWVFYFGKDGQNRDTEKTDGKGIIDDRLRCNSTAFSIGFISLVSTWTSDIAAA